MGEIRRGNLSLSPLLVHISQPTDRRPPALPRPTTEDPLVRFSSSAGSGSNGRRKKKKPSRDGGEEKVLGAGDRGGGECVLAGRGRRGTFVEVGRKGGEGRKAGRRNLSSPLLSRPQHRHHQLLICIGGPTRRAERKRGKIGEGGRGPN